MDIRQNTSKHSRLPTNSLDHHNHPQKKPSSSSSSSSSSPTPKASDALPLPLYLTNAIFFTLFFSVAYYLLLRWRHKIRTSTSLHVLTLTELAAILSLVASFIYLLGFFGIDFVQSFISRPSNDHWDERFILHEDSRDFHVLSSTTSISPSPMPKLMELPPTISAEEEEELANSVVSGEIPSLLLGINFRRLPPSSLYSVQRTTGRSLSGLPLKGFDYESILGQCCEMRVGTVGYVQIPVGIAGRSMAANTGCQWLPRRAVWSQVPTGVARLFMHPAEQPVSC